MMLQAIEVLQRQGSAFVPALIGASYGAQTLALSILSEAIQRPLVTYLTTNIMIVPQAEKGWLAQTCFSQGIQAQVILASLKSIGWHAISVIAEFWGEQFIAQLKESINVPGQVIAPQLFSDGISEETLIEISQLKATTGSGVWALWSMDWISLVPGLAHMGLVSPSNSYMVYTEFTPTDPSTVTKIQGWFYVGMEAGPHPCDRVTLCNPLSVHIV